MFLLLLGHQHYDSGWTFIDIGPYSIDSMEITFMSVSQFLSTNYWYNGLLNLRVGNIFQKHFKAMFHFGRTKCFTPTFRKMSQFFGIKLMTSLKCNTHQLRHVT